MTETIDVTAKMMPVEWTAECPVCTETHPVERVSHDIYGYFSPDDESKFILCDCGVTIEINGVEVPDFDPSPNAPPAAPRAVTDAWDYLLGEVSANRVVLHDGILDTINNFIKGKK